MTNAQKISGANDAASLTERAREAASSAGEKVAAAASSTVEAAKDHPYAAAGIVAGVAAAVGGAAYAATKLSDSVDDGPGSKPKSAQ
ncbi:hypothetical protein F1C10_03610 [Sphingomonas sp. NBWT7]|uniref:hypothetical protein n=1 Tax=Sphingomonas sp. NBWT7 TaxID=2596913 RepID=UPI00162A1315|nr:hypothetical protein [Sphingomonas sp. NBWT7]QNE31119.1 hypothetical protein F1C10_03610 [Sphingomonas sp. NBWT7]